ncbi:phosphoribosyltransferase family protein [uncultured Chitinophaga sp.]|jgi:Phosphoribosylpyrophosphate synthetase|uniref:phosphoribosyltransferase family protein n=1 Tax=uncultured Chitinophaga sp. TaxID=339340 RepID=UPI00260B8D69|nr:phosphoribosyltransferase family protein [uncultured Chitinophaga sp.]
MLTLNLIYPERSDIRFTTMVFPDGQPHIKIDMDSITGLDRSQPLRILTRIANTNDLLLALFIKNTLDYLEFEQVELHVAYLLAARMDRVMLDGEPFSLKIVAGILNQAQFKKVKIFDPHSEVATALIDRSYAVSNHQYVKDALAHYFNHHPATPYCLVSPDAGALKKIHKLAQFLAVDHVVECMKERDVRTGALTSFKTTAGQLNGLTCFLVDDICDGGGTFAGTAKMLKGKGAQKVNLVVSHGIFSKGTVIESVDEIYTTDSFRDVENVQRFEVGKYL